MQGRSVLFFRHFFSCEEREGGVFSEKAVLLLTFCLLLLSLCESLIVLCFVVRYFMYILVLQSS